MATIGKWVLGVSGLNLNIVPFEQRPDASSWSGGPLYRTEMVFTTRNGSWDKGGTGLGSIDDWAVDAFLSGSKINGAGGDHNLFVIVLDKDGKPVKDKGLLFWKGPLKANPNQMQFDQKNTGADGSENVPVFGSYGPERNEHGDHGATTIGRADVITGVGMPLNNHVSVFFVLKEAGADVPPIEGDLGDIVAKLNAIHEDLRALMQHLGAID